MFHVGEQKDSAKWYDRFPTPPQLSAENRVKCTLVFQDLAGKEHTFIYMALTKAILMITQTLKHTGEFNFSLGLDKKSCYFFNSINDCYNVISQTHGDFCHIDSISTSIANSSYKFDSN